MLDGFDIDLAADTIRLASRLRDVLTSIFPALERVVGERLGQPGVRDLLTKYPTLTALRAASQSRIERTVKARSPRIALATQDVTVCHRPRNYRARWRAGRDRRSPRCPGS